MSFFKKLIRKIKDGSLKEIIEELLWISDYSLRYKWSIAWYIFLGVFGVAMGYGGSVLSKFIIDTVTGQDTKSIVPVAIFYVLMILIRIGCNAWTSRISAKISIKVDQEIRADVYDKIMDADWEKMSQYHSGDLLNRIDNDVSAVSSSVLGWVPNLITGVVQFVGALGIILYFDPVLALISLLSAPVTLLMSRTTMKRLREYVKKSREASSGVMVFNQESFRNIQVIKSFGLTDVYSEKLREVQENYKDVQLAHNKFSIATSTIMSLVGALVATFCFGWGVYRLWSGDITYGTMTLFLQMATALSVTFSQLVQLFPNALSAATAAGRIMAVAELPKEKRDDDEKAKDFLDRNRENGITVKASEMGFAYGDDEPIFTNVDFVADPGEIVAIVGASGEGKTTMLRLILGIVEPKEGKIEVSCPKSDESLRISASTRCMFSFVPQNNTMFSGTVADNIRLLNRDATDEEVYNALKTACAYDFVSQLPEGINTPMAESSGFSEGQLQRLSVARAILADMPVLLFDEATSALDTVTERQLLRNIVENEKGKTCIITTHRPGVLSVCDRIYEIKDDQLKVVQAEEILKTMIDF